MHRQKLGTATKLINPHVPVFITDRTEVLTETIAITVWFEARETERRTSFDPRLPETGRMHQTMAFVNTGFIAMFSPLYSEQTSIHGAVA